MASHIPSSPSSFEPTPLPLPDHSMTCRHQVHQILRTPGASLPTRPFQWATFAHLDEAVTQAIRHGETGEGLRPTTRAWMKGSYQSLAKFLRESNTERIWLAGDLTVQGEGLNNWIGWQRTRGVSHTTINTNWRGCRFLFVRVATQAKMLNPFFYLPVPKASRPLPRALTKTQAEDVLRSVRNLAWRHDLERTRNVAVVGIMLLAGLRRGEVLALEYGNVNLDQRTIRIRRGKGRDGGKDRTAYMPDQLHEMLVDYRTVRDRSSRTHPEFFTDARQNVPMTLDALRTIFERLSEAVTFPVSPHMLRHSFVTLLRQANVPDRVAMELAGHSDLRMLQRYSQVFEGEHVREINKVRLEL